MNPSRIVLACLLMALPFATVRAADLGATADTNIDSTAPNANYGSNPVLRVSGIRTALVAFDPAAVARSTGRTAVLQLKVAVTNQSSNVVTIRLVGGAWAEKTVNAKTFPALGAVLDQRTVVAQDRGQLVSFDVSAALAAWRSNPAGNFGLAIVGGTPAPNLQFGSREGGAAAMLRITGGGVVADNDVTVAPSGADYPDPGAAIANMADGDHWCVSSTASRPCIVRVAAGVYAVRRSMAVDVPLKILGDEKGETIILSSAAGLLAVADLTMTDLTLQSPGLALDHEGSSLRLERVRLRGGERALSLGGRGPATIVDSDITAEADGETVTVDMESLGGSVVFQRSRISAISRQNYARAFEITDSAVGGVVFTFQDSSISAWGKAGANALATSDEWSSIVVTGTSVDVASPAGAVGLAGIDAPVQVINSRISAHGEVGTGFDWSGNAVVLDDVTIDATATAARIDPPDYSPSSFGSISVLRSHLNAGVVALFMSHSAGNLQSSVLTARTAAMVTAGSTLTAVSGQLGGAVTLTNDSGQGVSTASCTRVLDASLAVRPAKCN